MFDAETTKVVAEGEALDAMFKSSGWQIAECKMNALIAACRDARAIDLTRPDASKQIEVNLAIADNLELWVNDLKGSVNNVIMLKGEPANDKLMTRREQGSLTPVLVTGYQFIQIFMEPEVNPTNETQVDDSQLKSATGDEAVTQPETLTLAEINEITGMSYKSKDAALKSIKDMKSMAGKAADLSGKTDDIASLKTEIENLKEREFLARNPQVETNLEVLKLIAKGAGVSLQEAAELPQFKTLMESKTGTEAVTKRTIASSNNRTVQSTSDTPFNAAEHAGDANKMGEFVVNQFFKK